jgi:hypothetical protein
MLSNELFWLAAAAVLIGLGLVTISLSLLWRRAGDQEDQAADARPTPEEAEETGAFIDQPLSIDLQTALGVRRTEEEALREEPPGEAAPGEETAEDAPAPSVPLGAAEAGPSREGPPLQVGEEGPPADPQRRASAERERAAEELEEPRQAQRARRRRAVGRERSERHSGPEEGRPAKRRSGPFPSRRSR